MKRILYTLLFLFACSVNLYSQSDTTEEFPKGLHKRVWNSDRWWSYRTLGPVLGIHGFGKFGYEAGIGFASVKGSYQGAGGYSINLVLEHFPTAHVAGPKLNVWAGGAILLVGLGGGINAAYYTNYRTNVQGLCIRPEVGIWFPGIGFKYGVNLNQVKELGISRHVFSITGYWALWAPKKEMRKVVE